MAQFIERCIIELDPEKVVRSAQQTHHIPAEVLMVANGTQAVSRVLAGTLGSHATLKPFRLIPDFRGRIAVTGWGDPAAIERANLAASPSEIGIVTDVLAAGSVSIRNSARYRFDLLAMPLYNPRGSRNALRDVALRDLERGVAPTFEQRRRAYREWVSRKLGEAAEIEVFHLKECQLLPYPGKNAQAQWRISTSRYPHAHMQGSLVVRDEEAFAKIVRTGIGKSKAAGMGDMHLQEFM